MRLPDLLGPLRRSFRTKLLVALLGCVGLVVGVTYVVVRSETEGQVEVAVRRAADQARRASAELEELRRIELARLGSLFTDSPRTLAILESVLEDHDPEFRELLVQDLRYELQRQQLEASLVAFTDAGGRHVFTLLDGRETGGDPARVEPLARALLEGDARDLVAYRLVEGAPYMVRVLLLARSGVALGTAVLGLPVDDSAPQRISEVVGAEVCFVLQGRCVVGSDGVREPVAEAMVATAMGDGEGRAQAAGERWNLVAEPLSPDWRRDGWRVVALPLGRVLAPFERISGALTLTGLLALLASLGAALVLSRGLARPVRRLVEATSRVGRGEYDTRVEVRSEDEMGRLARAFNAMAEGLALKERYRGVLDKVVSREVAEELLRGEVVLGGENRVVSTLFADVTGFTALSEGMEPQGVIGLLNECMERLSRAVEAEKGVVDKYVGDEIMAIFGAPVSQGDDALRAVRAALRMQEAMEALGAERARRGEEPLGLAVGINTGTAVAGNMGSAERLNYTVLGEAVNLAARACQVAEAGEILVTGSTLERTGDALEVRSSGARTLKGFSRPVELFRVTGLLGGAPPGESRDAGEPGAPGDAGDAGGADADADAGAGPRDRSSGSGARTALVAALVAASLAGSGPIAAQQEGALPTLQDLGAVWATADGSLQLQLSGRLDVEAYAPSDEPAWLVPERDPFVAGRLRVFADVFVGRRVYGLVELRADRGEEPRAGSLDARVDQAYVRVHPLAGRSLSIQAGKLASPVGSYPRRHHTEDDPFIRPPAAYDRRTMVLTGEAPGSAGAWLGWKDDPATFRPRGAPPVWGAPYQWGALVGGRLGPAFVEAGAMNSAPSSGPGQWSLDDTFRRPPSWVGRITVPVSAELRLSAFYDRGPYLEAQGVAGLAPGADPDRYRQSIAGVEAVWARNRWSLRGEAMLDRWDVPNVPEEARDYSYYVEGRLRPRAGLYVAARWGAIAFSDVSPGDGPPPPGGYPDSDRSGWDYGFSRLQLAAGYRLLRNVELRGEYALNRTDGPRDPDDDLASVQLWWSF